MTYAHRPFTAINPMIHRRNNQALYSCDTYDDTQGIDWIAVERAAEGTIDPATLTRLEIRAAVHHMTDNGMPEEQIARHLHCAPRQVARDRKRPNPRLTAAA